MTRPDNLPDTLNKLNTLAPNALEQPRPAGQMLSQIKQTIHQPSPTHPPLLERILTMFSNRKPTIVALIATLIFAFAFSFPTVRAAASDFLGLFRVQKFAAISISPAQLALLQEVAEQGLYPGEIEMLTEPGQPQSVTSLGQASSETGYTLRTLPELGKPTAILVATGGTGRLIVNLEGARSLVSAAGADPLLLPDSLDGANVDVTVYDTVEQNWADGTFLIQTNSPLIDYPDDVNPVVLGEALLQLLGMTDGEARRLANSIDWTSTLLLPIPQDFATFSEVQVDSTSGLALQSLDGSGSTLMWQKDGMVYLIVSDTLSGDDLVKLADGLE